MKQKRHTVEQVIAKLRRADVRGAPASGLLQLVRDGRLVALLEAEAGLPELRTVRVFLEGTAS